MDTMEAILTRRSIRDYTKEAVPGEIIQELLQAAMSAPSSKGLRPWHFLVIDNRRILNRIPLYFPYTYMIRRAPVAIIVCGDEKQSAFGPYWTLDCAAATENILLAARAKGLGAVWCGVYLAEEPQEVSFQSWLGIPENVIPFSIVPLGYPAESKPPSEGFDTSRIHLNHW